MSTVETGDWMQSRTSPAMYLEVLSTTTDGGVTIRMGKDQANTTQRYLRQNYMVIGADDAEA